MSESMERDMESPNRFPFGVAYYPEQWPTEDLNVDVESMREARLNVVRLAEFAWSLIEPDRGSFEFGWLDLVIEQLAERDIDIVLGTPTASPPPWLISLDESILRVSEDGRRLVYGARREYCPNHPSYRVSVAVLVSAMVAKYGQDPRIRAWQVDNELGGRCFCPNCRQSFHVWLQQRYGTVKAVNEAWGTVFWSHIYQEWDEIPVPIANGIPHNPGLHLDYLRFQSDSYVDFQRAQIEIIRTGSQQPITHNLMGVSFPEIDYFDLSADLDFVSWDNYLWTQWNMDSVPAPADRALEHRAMRGMKRKGYWVMEQQSGAAGWDIVARPPKPGQMRLWTYQSVGYGADGILFFRWRTARKGAEQFWHGLLDHDGHRGRRFDEARVLGEELSELGSLIVGTEPVAQVALLLSNDSRFAFEIQRNNPEFDYLAHIRLWHAALHKLGVEVDVVGPGSDLKDYRVIVAPSVYIVGAAIAADLESFVHSGGVLISTFRSGVKDEANAVVDARLPGLLAGICGVEVEEYDSLPAAGSNRVTFDDGSSVQTGTWCDVLVPRGAEPIAHYEEDFYAGAAAITRHRYGAGHAFYVGTMGGTELCAVLAGQALQLAGVEVGPDLPDGVELMVRRGPEHLISFLLNHNDQPVHLEAGPWTHTDVLLDGETAPDGSLSIPGYGVASWIAPVGPPSHTGGPTG